MRPDGTAPRPLLELARAYGVLGSFRAQGGKRQHASPEALLGVLRALGAPVTGPDDAPGALRSRLNQRLERRVAPVTVAWSPAASVRLRLPHHPLGTALECRLELEEGEEREWRAAGEELPGRRVREVEGRRWLFARLPLPAPLPEGYHELTIRSAAWEARTCIVRAPATTWDAREAAERGEDDAQRTGRRKDFGLFLPAYALRTARSWGTADLRDLRALLEWSGGRGAAFVGTLPLMAAFLDPTSGPFAPGPYSPASRLFWNELFLDVENAPGLGDSPEARELLASPALREELARLRDAPRVRYAESMAVKRKVIEGLARAVAPADRPLAGPLEAYARSRPEAVDYARFRAVGERLRAPWRDWPEAPRDGLLREHAGDEEAFRYHLYAQWAMEGQIAALREGGLPVLYLDLPLGTHPDGYDVWRHRDCFAAALSGGAPPDAFFSGGQDWGFPPLHPEESRVDGHAYVRRSLRHLMGASGMLRLDHVMSLHRLYCIPAGSPPGEGAYVRYPAEELYAIVCLESHRTRCEIVGEDLGTVPDEVREAMERRRLHRMYVLPFELEPLRVAASTAPREPEADGPEEPGPGLPPPPELCVASLGTHDLPPFAAFWSGVDVDQRVAHGLATEEEADGMRAERDRWRGALAAVLEAAVAPVPRPHAPAAEEERERAVLGATELLARSGSRHVLVNAEDLWLELEPQNVPGTSGEENWTRKARHPLEEWNGLPGVEKALAVLRRAGRTVPGAGGGGGKSRETGAAQWRT